MENGWNLLNSSTSGGRGQNGNSTNLTWDIWELGNTSRFDWNNNSQHSFNRDTTTASITAAVPPVPTTSTTHPDESAVHSLMFSHHGNNPHHSSFLYAGGINYHPDPHLTCLKLGKRHYFEDPTRPMGERPVAKVSITKRFKPYCDNNGGTSAAEMVTSVPPLPPVPRCQVEGCHVALVNVKDYHRRHKVCEMHSKAVKVVVLGVDQRFCQQCSRFHAVSEFDDAKRSCRRRLAGHNERRRKSSHDHYRPRNSSQDTQLMADRYQSYLSKPTGRALSLLSSSKNNNSWISSADLSSRCSAALHELIAEHRAAILARQMILDRDWHWHQQYSMEDTNGAQSGSSSVMPHQLQMFPESLD